MGTFTQVLRSVRKKLIISSVLSLAFVGAVAGALAIQHNSAEAAGGRDYSHNSIIPGGAVTRAEFVARYNANAQRDLPAIYNAYGMAPNEIERFSRTAVAGVAYKNGDIYVGSKKVATGAFSLGRDQKNGDHAKVIAGHTYWEGANSTAFAANSIPALVMMNGDQFEFATLQPCANAMGGHPTGHAPSYACKTLTVTPIQNSTTNYSFHADASAVYGAKIAYYVYDFGDGSKQQTTATTVTHNYTKEGTFNTKVTVYVTVNGSTIPVNAASCAKQVHTKLPPPPTYACTALTARMIGAAKDRRFGYNLAYTATNGAALRDVDYKFGDGATQNGVKPADVNKVEHTFPGNGAYTTIATLHFTVGAAVKDVACQVNIPPFTPPVCEVNPSLPADSPDCNKYLCSALNVATIDRTTFRFKAESELFHAQFVKYTYVVKDAAGQQLASIDGAQTQTVNYTQATAGAYTVQAYLTAHVNNQDKTVTDDAKCKKPFEVTEKPVTPEYACQSLVLISKDSRTSFTFKVTPEFKGNVQVVGYHFNFGDGATKPAQPGEETQAHTYAAAGTYTTTVTIDFMVDGQPKTTAVTNACSVKVTVVAETCADHPLAPECQPPVEECKPGVPVNSPDCVEKPPVEVPPVLPSTGPESLIGGLFATSGLGLAVPAWIKSRRVLRDSQNKR